MKKIVSVTSAKWATTKGFYSIANTLNLHLLTTKPWKYIYIVKLFYNMVIFPLEYSQKTLHISPIRARYGVSFCEFKIWSVSYTCHCQEKYDIIYNDIIT